MKNYFKILVIVIVILLFISTPVSASFIHRVESRDSLYRLANRYKTSVEKIALMNNLYNINSIYKNQILIIPEESYAIRQNTNGYYNDIQYLHTVNDGDTIYKIALEYNTTIENLINLNKNNLENPNHIVVNQNIVVRDPNKEISLKTLYPDTIFHSGNKGKKQISLTFDDGPDSVYTPGVLDILKEEGVPATFFVMGSRVKKYPKVSRRIVNEGHVIANHTWSHPDISKVGINRIKNEVLSTENIIYDKTGLRTKLIRPPYGAISENAVIELITQEYKIINWNVDSVDWKDRDWKKILVNTLPDVRNGSIILMHSAGGEGQDLSQTIKALPDLIYTLRVQGYEFVHLHDILDLQPYK